MPPHSPARHALIDMIRPCQKAVRYAGYIAGRKSPLPAHRRRRDPAYASVLSYHRATLPVVVTQRRKCFPRIARFTMIAATAFSLTLDTGPTYNEAHSRRILRVILMLRGD